jgi:hypothetical protein
MEGLTRRGQRYRGQRIVSTSGTCRASGRSTGLAGPGFGIGLTPPVSHLVYGMISVNPAIVAEVSKWPPEIFGKGGDGL